MNHEEQSRENEENLLDKMNQIKEQYYKKNGRNSFFKNKQIKQCSENICNQFDSSVMISNTIKVLPESNIVLLDYQIFKMFTNEYNYDLIINYTIQIFDSFVINNQPFKIQINVKGISVSSVERYKDFIKLLCARTSDKYYSMFIEEITIINKPSVIDFIMPIIKPLIEKSIYEKFRI